MRERSVIDIASDLLGRFPTLVRQETALARVELSENMAKIASGMVVLVIGAVLMIPALTIMLLAGVYGIENAGLAPWASALIAGGAAFVVAIVVMLIGVARARAVNIVPQRTVRQIQEDAAVARRQTGETIHDFQRAA